MSVLLDEGRGGLIIKTGPMCSGKSGDLVRSVEALRYTNGYSWELFQPISNSRDGAKIAPRGALHLPATQVVSAADIVKRCVENRVRIVGIDEAFMFDPLELKSAVAELLGLKTLVIVATLDMSYMGTLTEGYKALLELSPTRVDMLRAVCATCSTPHGTHTIVRKNGVPIFSGYPELIPEGVAKELSYEPACLSCFIGYKRSSE